jgi:hypothetical protein
MQGVNMLKAAKTQVRPAVLRKAESAAERHGGVKWVRIAKAALMAVKTEGTPS